MRRAIIIPILLNLLLAAFTQAAPVQANPPLELHSGSSVTPVLELYTSQGCSSCPPAERWLSQLTESPSLWEELIPLAFHVDYWDGLGWADPFAQPGFSRRQRDYAANGTIGAVYTPGFIVAGREWRGWFKGEPLPESRRQQPGQLDLRLDGNQVELKLQAGAAQHPPLTAHVVRLGFGLTTPISRGENAGSTLRHDFVVLTHQQAAGATDGLSWRLQLQPEARGERQAIAAWLSRGSDPMPYQAVAGWLEPKTDLSTGSPGFALPRVQGSL